MKLAEIFIEDTEYHKRTAIQVRLGQEVILKDEHEKWCHGFLYNCDYDSQTYLMQISDERGRRRLHYHDLQQLLIING